MDGDAEGGRLAELDLADKRAGRPVGLRLAEGLGKGFFAVPAELTQPFLERLI